MRITCVCLNLWLGGKLFDAILEFLRGERPDILAVQEAYHGRDAALERRLRSIETLQKECGFEHVSYSPACRDVRPEGAIESGNAIFSRYPITKTQTIFFDVPFGERRDHIEGGGDYSYTPRNIQEADIAVAGRTLTVLNTQGIWGIDGKDSPRRLAMARTIVEMVRGKKATLLMGDFNIRENTETIRMIEQEMVNVFKNELVTSFNMRRKANQEYGDSVVDMIFVSRDVHVVEHSCPDVDISDHLPLVCRFEVGSALDKMGGA